MAMADGGLGAQQQIMCVFYKHRVSFHFTLFRLHELGIVVLSFFVLIVFDTFVAFASTLKLTPNHFVEFFLKKKDNYHAQQCGQRGECGNEIDYKRNTKQDQRQH